MKLSLYQTWPKNEPDESLESQDPGHAAQIWPLSDEGKLSEDTYVIRDMASEEEHIAQYFEAERKRIKESKIIHNVQKEWSKECKHILS